MTIIKLNNAKKKTIIIMVQKSTVISSFSNWSHSIEKSFNSIQSLFRGISATRNQHRLDYSLKGLYGLVLPICCPVQTLK